MKEIKNNSNKVINLHLFVSLFISAGLYFPDKGFALAFVAGSLALNLYLRLLQNAFWLALAAKLNLELENKALLIIFSSIRTLIIGSIFAFFILKLKFNLIALAAAFICYNIIVVLAAIQTQQAKSN